MPSSPFLAGFVLTWELRGQVSELEWFDYDFGMLVVKFHNISVPYREMRHYVF